jgi:phospholipid/cholesterol/gamma-HCH transport system permease protein
MSEPTAPARADASLENDTLVVRLGGDWEITAAHPLWSEALGKNTPAGVRIENAGLGSWDSSLALFLRAAQAWSEAHSAAFAMRDMPEGVNRLMGILAQKRPAPALPHAGVPNLVAALGKFTLHLVAEAKDLSRLVGECVFSVSRFFRGRAQFRWSDCFIEMQQCGVMALPIVGLISFLVGVTLAYTGAIVVRQYGGDIWIADMIGLAMTREMGPIMAAVVLAGRTGAAYAAYIGNMKANEEVDALATLGVSPVDFLIMPRIAALAAMMPLLALYSDGMGILGGMLVAYLPPLNIAPSLFFSEMQTIVDLSDINTGLIKAATFGVLIAVAGCWRGLQADRSAAGVGQAATSAVVTGVLLIVVGNAVYAVIFDILKW